MTKTNYSDLLKLKTKPSEKDTFLKKVHSLKEGDIKRLTYKPLSKHEATKQRGKYHSRLYAQNLTPEYGIVLKYTKAKKAHIWLVHWKKNDLEKVTEVQSRYKVKKTVNKNPRINHSELNGIIHKAFTYREETENSRVASGLTPKNQPTTNFQTVTSSTVPKVPQMTIASQTHEPDYGTLVFDPDESPLDIPRVSAEKVAEKKKEVISEIEKDYDIKIEDKKNQSIVKLVEKVKNHGHWNINYKKNKSLLDWFKGK